MAACAQLCVCLCVGVGRRCRQPWLLPAFSTHSASPQVACCEMSVAEELKISSLLLLLTAGADGTVGPQPAPWALGEEELLDEGLGQGRKRGPFQSIHSSFLLVFLGSQARLQVHFFQEALQAPPRPAPPHPTLPNACHLLIRVSICMCLKYLKLSWKEMWFHHTPGFWGRTFPPLSVQGLQRLGNPVLIQIGDP